MTSQLNLTSSRRGAWIINTTKHLLYDITHPALSSLENLLFAGKCGSLLIKLSADVTEQLSDVKVKAHARLCGIAPQELGVYLSVLQSHGCIDWDSQGTLYEVLAFSRQRVLTTTAAVFDGSIPSSLEEALVELLELCLLRPRLEMEIREHLAQQLCDEDMNHLLGLVVSLDLLGVIRVGNGPQRLYFNGYQFGDRATDIGKALESLGKEQRDELNFFLEAVAKRPGTLLENVRASEATVNLAIGLGLVDVSEVSSKGGTAKFLTMPRLAPPSVGRETSHLEDDVFHHAKMLLSSLRFGESKSSPGRGRINNPSAIVNSLLNGYTVGPCTAIGEDYVLLESEGIIRTTRATNRRGAQFSMELRRREPAEMVLGLLESGASGSIDAKSLPSSLVLPLTYSGPESSRPRAVRRIVAEDPEAMKRFLEALRT